MKPRVAILTMSDRAYAGIYQDQSGPAIASIVQNEGWIVAHQAIVPDHRAVIEAVLNHWSQSEKYDLILTTGGTGLGPRDVTPEATRSVIEKEIPGLSEIMRLETRHHNGLSVLSRAVAGVCRQSLIINLPGNPTAVVECLNAILPVINHALDMIKGHQHPHLEKKTTHD